MGPQPQKTISFGDFELDRTKRRLLRHGETIVLNAKAFDVLVYLTENAGRIVTKDEILNSVWENQFVEEANLVVQISALRKALGESKNDPKILVTIPGKGYEFIADVETADEYVIESHRISRISVEEVSDESLSSVRSLTSGRFSTAQKLTALAVVAGIAVIAIASYLFSDRRPTENAKAAATSQRATSKPFTVALGVPDRVAISSDGKTLAYVARVNGRNMLQVGDVETGNSVPVIPVSDRHYDLLAFSPDGKSIYFTARDESHPRSTLMRVSTFGGAVQELIPNADSCVTFSPDGKTMAFLRQDADSDRRSIVVADAASGKNEQVIWKSDEDVRPWGASLAWSPDGQVIAFSAIEKGQPGSAIFAINVNDRSLNRISGRVDNRIVNIAWLHDGSGLLINRNTSNDASDGQIWFAPYPSGEIRPVTNDLQNYALFNLSVSENGKAAVIDSRTDPEMWFAPNGDLENAQKIVSGNRIRLEGQHGIARAPDGKILFTAKSADGRTIWEMDASGENQRQLTPSQKDSDDQQLCVTSDNRYIVFQSNRSGTTQVWRANRDGTNLIRLTDGPSSGEPTVLPDGRTIIYCVSKNSTSTIWRISIDGGEAEQIIDDDCAWPAVSPDGRYIACAYGRPVNSFFKGIAIFSVDGGKPLNTFGIPPGAILFNRLRWSADGKSILYKDELQGIWQQDLTAISPTQLPGIDNSRVFHFVPTPEGMLMSIGRLKGEIILLENFSPVSPADK